MKRSLDECAAPRRVGGSRTFDADSAPQRSPDVADIPTESPTINSSGLRPQRVRSGSGPRCSHGRGYSVRNAVIASIRRARQEETRHAAAATTVEVIGTTTYVSGSVDFTP